MKKLLLLIPVMFILVNCEVSVRESNARDNSQFEITKLSRNVYMMNHHEDGLEYRIFNRYKGGLYVVNHTKELLEVELLKEVLKNKRKVYTGGRESSKTGDIKHTQ